MKTAKIESVELMAAKLPDGEYEGTWSGYYLGVVHAGSIYRIKIDEGIRGRATVRVVVTGEQCEITVLKLGTDA